MRKLIGAALAAIVLAACSPTIHDSTYQSFTVQLTGPNPKWVQAGQPRDPFAATAKYVVTVKYFEDAAGTIPYGKSLKSLPQPLQTFNPVQKFTVAGTKTSFTLGDGNQVLPQVSAGGSIYLLADVVGYDSTGAAIARARCPIEQLSPSDGGAGSGVTCLAFYGFLGKWNPIHGPNTPRYDFAAQALPDGRVVVAGGLQTGHENSGALSSVEVYDPAAQNTDGSYGQWTNRLNLGQQRYELTAAMTDDGFVFFAGGRISSQTFSKDLDVFDSQNTTMQSPRQLLVPRAEHASAPFNGNSVIVAGGFSNSTTVATGSEQLTVTGGSSTQVAASQQPRGYGCLVAVKKSLLLFCGGGFNSCETFDGQNFTTSGTLATARADVKCAAVGGNAYLVGGIDSTDASAGKIEEWSNGSITPYDTSALAARTHHALAVSDGKVVVAGGITPGDPNNTPLSTGFWFDPAAKDGEHPISGVGTEMMAARADFQMVTLPDDTVMAIGGRTPTGQAQGTTVPGAEIFVVPDGESK